MVLSWPLIAYVVLGVAAAGLLGVQGARVLRGRASEVRIGAVVVALVLALGAAVAATLRLGRIDRVFNVFAHLSSGISQGYAVILLMIAMAVVFIVMVRRGEDDGGAPRWCGAAALAVALLGVYGIAANLTATGLSMGRTLLTMAYLLAASTASGLLLDGGMRAMLDKASDAGGIAVPAAAVSGLTGVLAVLFNKVAPTLGGHAGTVVKTQYGMWGSHITAGLDGAAAAPTDVPFWICAVVIGAIVPLVAGLALRKVKGTPAGILAIAACVCVLAGVGVAVAVTLFNGQAVQIVSR